MKLTSVIPKQPSKKVRAQKEARAIEEHETQKESAQDEAQDDTAFLNKQFATLPARREGGRAGLMTGLMTGLKQPLQTMPAPTPSSRAAQFPPRFSQIQQTQQSRNKIKEAFIAIKHDMLSVKETQHQHSARMGELKQILKNSQADYVTIDKFNVIKIKLSELDDLIKKLQDHTLRLAHANEDRTKAVESRDQMQTTSVTAVTVKFDKLKSDLKALEQTMASKEQLHESLGEYRALIEDLQGQLQKLFSKKDVLTPQQEQKMDAALAGHLNAVQIQLKEFKKGMDVYVTESQTEQLLAGVDAEFDCVKEEIAEILKTQKEFKLGPKFAEDVDAVQKQVAVLEKSLKSLVTQKQVQNVLDDVNGEFDKVQNEFNLIHNEIRSGFNVFATKKELQQTHSKWKENLDDLRKMAGQNTSDVAAVRKELQQELKNYATKDQLAIEVDDVHKEVHEIADAVKKLYDRRKSGPDLADIDKRLAYHMMTTKEKYVERCEHNALVNDVNRVKKLLNNAQTKKKVATLARASDLKASQRLAKPKIALPQVDQQGKHTLNFLGTFFIVVAFGLLILDILFFYLNVLTQAGTVLSVASVACFVAGMVIRIYLTLSGNK